YPTWGHHQRLRLLRAQRPLPAAARGPLTMAGVVELLAQSLGWQVRKTNCIVEGTSDVFYFEHAARLYRERHDVDPLGDDFAVLPAGRGEEGGVDGINDRFRMAKQLADLDLRHDGSR